MGEFLKLVKVLDIVIIIVTLSILFIGCGEDKNPLTVDTNEEIVFKGRSGSKGDIFFPVDDNTVMTFHITDQTGSPLPGIIGYVLIENSWATIICIDPSRKYSSTVYSVSGSLKHDIRLKSYQASELNVTETTVVPNHILSLPEKDKKWQRIEGTINEIMEYSEWIGNGYSFTLDIVNSGKIFGPNSPSDAIIFENLKTLKESKGSHLSSTAKYVAYLNGEDRIAIVIRQAQDPAGTVVLRVRDRTTKAGISQAQLTLGSAGVQTVNDGWSRVDGISAGKIDLVVTHEGYATLYTQVIVESARASIAEIDLIKQYEGDPTVLSPDSSSETGIPGELTIHALEKAISTEQYPGGIKVDVQRVDPDISLELYAVLSPLAPIYHIDAGNARFAQPVKVRIATSNIHIPAGTNFEDLQIVAWDDLDSFRFLPTAVGPGRKWLEAEVTHFSYFTVQIKPKASFFGGSQFVITEPLHITLENGCLAFDNLFSRVEAHTARGLWDWLFTTPLELPQWVWISYEVQVLQDGLLDDAISSMQVFRVVWSPAYRYDAEWTNPDLKVGHLPRHPSFQLIKRESRNNTVMGKEVVAIFDRRGRRQGTQQSIVPIGDSISTGDFLRQVFRLDTTRCFLDASLLDDPDARYFLQISRQYVGNWLAESSETVVSDKFSPYDIAPTIELKEPNDGITIQDANPRFTWHSESLPGIPVNHELLISTYPNPHQNPNYNVKTGPSRSFFNGQGQVNRITLEPGLYFWCVRAYNYDGKRQRAETYSRVWTLHVEQPNCAPNLPNPPKGSLGGDTGVSYPFSAQTDDPDSDKVAYKFDWGDGNYSDWTSYVSSGTTTSASYSWERADTYSVKVKARDIHGNESDWSSPSSITITKPPNREPQRPSSPSGPPSGITGKSYSFSASTTDLDGDKVAFKFDWGDGGYSDWTSYVPSGSSASASHSWWKSGTYTVKVKAKDDEGNESGWSIPGSDTAIADKNIPPTARASATPTSGTEPLAVSFSSSGSDDPDVSIVSYRWDFKDGSSSTSANPTHTFRSAGTYNVTLRVTDDDGATDTDSIRIRVEAKEQEVQVSNSPPERPGCPSPSVNDAIIGQTIKVYAYTVDPDGDDIAYKFNWKDGNVSSWSSYVPSGSSAHMSHSWSSAGRYNVIVKAKDSHGNGSDWSSCAVEIRIAEVSQGPNDPIISNITVDPNPIPASNNYGGTLYVTAQITDPNGPGDIDYVECEVSTVGDSERTVKPYGPPSDDWDRMYDDGTHGDAVAGDGIFTIGIKWSAHALPGIRYVNIIVWDKSKIVNRRASAIGSAKFIQEGPGTDKVSKNPPNRPDPPSGPSGGKVGQFYVFSASATDSDGDKVAYKFDWGDGDYSDWTSYVSSGSSASASHSWSKAGTYSVKVKAKDSNESESSWSSSSSIKITEPQVSNTSPNTPTLPRGPSEGTIGKSYSFSVTTTDPDGDEVAYKFHWGNSVSEWTPYVASGSSASASHFWSIRGTYPVKVKAKDIHGNESDWSAETIFEVKSLVYELTISPPRLDFGAIKLFGGGKDIVVTIRNELNVSVTLSKSWPAVPNAGFFIEPRDDDFSIGAHGTFSITVKARPSSLGPWSTEITLSDKRGQVIARIPITGETVLGNQETKKANITASITPSTIEYGSTETIIMNLKETSGVGVSINKFSRQVYAGDALISDESYEVNIRIEGNDTFSTTSKTSQETWSGPTGSRWVYSFAGVDDNGNKVSASVQLKIISKVSNRPPNRPNPPSGPSEGVPGKDYSFSAITTDPDGDKVAYKFDWGDGDYSDWTSYVSSGSSDNKSHSWYSDEIYSVRVKAKDSQGNESEWSRSAIIAIKKGSNPPVIVDGPTTSEPLFVRERIIFIVTVEDPDRDDVFCMFDWGDGSRSDWIKSTPNPFGLPQSDVDADHTYFKPGKYSIRAKAKDRSGNTSDWSSTEITIYSNPPDRPDPPSGPSKGIVGRPYSFSTSATDPDGDKVAFKFDWEDGSMSEWTSYVPSGSSASASHSWSKKGIYLVTVTAKDEHGEESYQRSYSEVKITENTEPIPPDPPSGPSKGEVEKSYSFSTKTTDYEGDKVAFKFDWGDGSMSEWTSYVPSGSSASASHSWSKEDTYYVKAKAKDSEGNESGWSSFSELEIYEDAINIVSIMPDVLPQHQDVVIKVRLKYSLRSASKGHIRVSVGRDPDDSSIMNVSKGVDVEKTISIGFHTWGSSREDVHAALFQAGAIVSFTSDTKWIEIR